jgi:aerobic carbon-monoxide dehydrogenase medium subunit
MKPGVCQYSAPRTVDEAVVLLAEHGDAAAVLAGGQSLIPMMNLRLARPDQLVDITRIGALRSVEQGDAWAEIGAAVTQAEAERGCGVPLLVDALQYVGHPTTRNLGTVCGSVAHADPAAEIPAVLVALGGEVILRSRRGPRTVPAEAFFRGYFTTARAPDELVCAVRLPTSNRKVAFAEATPRLGGEHGEFATVGVAVAIEIGDGGVMEVARIVLLGVDDIPHRTESAERLLLGSRPGAEVFAAAAEAVAAEIDPPGDTHAGPAQRRRLAQALTRRALTAAVS